MSEGIGRVAAGDGPASSPPGAAIHKGRRQRRPTGAPPPLPHPVTITTTAWLVVAAVALTVAFVASQHTPWLRVEDRASTWLLRQLAGIRTPWLTDVANGIKAAGTGWGVTVLGAVGHRPDHGLPALAASAGVHGQRAVPGYRRNADLQRAVAATPVRRADHHQLGRVFGGVAPGGGPDDLTDGRRLLPGRARPPPHLGQGGGGRRGRGVRPGAPVPGRRSPRRCAARRGVRGGDRGHRLPLLHPQRGVPGRLPAGPDRARGCDRPARARRSGRRCATSSG